MKKTAALIASLSLLSIPAIAQDEVAEPKAQGHRIGLGFASTEEPDLEVSFGKGLKLEYGYEFNNIVGINLSYAGFGEDVLGGLFKVEGSTFKLDTDLGYTFHFDNFAIKPYGAIGVVRIDEEWTALGEKESYDDTTIFVGIGARATLFEHYYTDIRFEAFASEILDYDQFSMTFGYRF
ncbi:porin family protein [Vibrio ishigakensis]|uniref:porin family protein n=1 Tax=Vibrio ishigakensis TaxID=1481914 RepID=UPI0021C274A5|nr:porin family protein [Vibrio ishigakensis]